MIDETIKALAEQVTKQAETTQEISAHYIPNLLALHPDTEFWVYREFIPRHDAVEITVYYREPGEDKMRVDALIDADLMMDSVIGPQHVKITYWGSAIKYGMNT